MINDRTPYLDLPLPNQENDLSEDLPRLRQAFVALDAKAASQDTAMQGVVGGVYGAETGIAEEADRATGAEAALSATIAAETCRATEAEADLSAALATVGVPSGIITMWSGAVTAIPPGWLLCDGENGTPDLRDRFLVGAGNTYAAGDTGGADAVTPTGTATATTLTIAQMPTHGHQSISANTGTVVVVGGAMAGSAVMSISQSSQNIGGGWSHDHGLTIDAIDTRPPYYALAYIMKT